MPPWFALGLALLGSGWCAFVSAERRERRDKPVLADATTGELRVHGVIGQTLAGAGVAMVSRPELGLDTLLVFCGWMALAGVVGAIRWARGWG